MIGAKISSFSRAVHGSTNGPIQRSTIKTFRFTCLVVLGLIAATAFAPFSAAAAPEAAFVVNTKADTDDGTCSAANCTLREAIHAANATAGLDTINFNIAACLCPIIVSTPLPEITDPVIINGYSQPGATANTLNGANDAVLKIQLYGLTAPAGTNGLVISAGGTTVKGLIISYFKGAGIWLRTGGSNTIEGNWIGIGPNGIADQGNGRGILLTHGTSLNTLGSSTPAGANLISGNTAEGIRLDMHGGSSDRNVVLNSIIGQDKGNQNAVPNGTGILVLSKRNTIGRANANQFLQISSNAASGIEIRGPGAVKNIVGSSSISENGTYGVWIHEGASKNKIGTKELVLIHHNGAAGVAIQDDNSLRNTVRSFLLLNGGLGIDLGADGLTLNDNGDADTGPNLKLNYPAITRAIAVTNRVKGKIKAAPNAKYKIDLYLIDACDAIGHGEGYYMQTVAVTTDANGAAKFNTVLTNDFDATLWLTATATDAKGNTSEFSECKHAE